MLTYLKLSLMACIWGGTFIAGKVLAADVGAFSAAFLRFSIASIALLALLLYNHGGLPRLERRQVLPLFILGLSGIFIYNLCFFKGLALIDASRAAIIIASNPALIALAAWLFFKEKMSAAKSLGILISLLGALLAISRGDLTKIVQAFGEGEMYICIAALSWVTYSIVGKKVLSGLSPLVAVSYATFIGSALLLPAALHEGLLQQVPSFELSHWLNLGYLSLLGTVLGFIWFYQGIERIGATRAGLFINVVPISAIMLSVLILDEPLSLAIILGTALVCLGVVMVNNAK